MSDENKRRPIRFRPEVAQAAQTKWLGQVILVRPMSFSFMCAFAGLTALLICGFLIWGQYTKTAAVSGHLVPNLGLIKIYTATTALIVETRVEEGQSVKKGDVLFVLSTERQSASGIDAQAAIGRQMLSRRDSLRDEIHKKSGLQTQQQAALQQKLKDVLEEARALNNEQETQEKRSHLAQAEMTRYRDLYQQKFISAGQLQQKESELLDQTARGHALKRSKLSIEKDIHSLQFELASLANKDGNELAAVRRAIASTEQELLENDARTKLQLLAPEDGVVTAILGERGQVATPSIALASIMPDGAELEAQLFAPSRSVGFLHPGSTVLLRYQAYPFQKFGHTIGKVKHVSRHALQGNELPLPNMGQEPLFRITVTLPSQAVLTYGQSSQLLAGMLVDGDILLDRRRLLEWLLEPIYSLKLSRDAEAEHVKLTGKPDVAPH